ncbi:MAG: twin-arginine translocation signal domain-containing protein [Acidobacteria bacterium]|nr:MAG: twin-arginine translocation signal domain-containing protein [Acidobacteriota bacterium]
MGRRIDRRSFLKRSSGAALGATAVSLLGPSQAVAAGENVFRSAWPPQAERPWAGPEYWANPLEDWRIRNGRLECIGAGGDRNVFLLTHDVSSREGTLAMSVRVGRMEDSEDLDEGYAGFRLGIKSFVDDYRARAIHGRGLNAGITAEGKLFIGEVKTSTPRVKLNQELRLNLNAQPSGGRYAVTLRAEDTIGKTLAEVTRQVQGGWLEGGVALVSSSGKVEPTPKPLGNLTGYAFYPPKQERGGNVRFWFADWIVDGNKVDGHVNHTFGPILFALYTVSRGVLKLSVQCPPMGNAPKEIRLEIRNGGNRWKAIATAELDPDAWNAVFRVPAWNDSKDHAYRLFYVLPDASGKLRQYTYEGTIRKDPKGQNEITVGLLTCMWDMGFPHAEFVRHLGWHKPDVLFWTGDQVYEPVGGFGVMETRDPELLVPSMHDYLRKWFLFGWATRDLTRHIPSVCMPDDHDMFHGNIWGCGGKATDPGLPLEGDASQDSGGYKMPARWVNMAQRTQTSHLPDPFDVTPIQQGIMVYYTHLQWGGISFAILEDRKWKSAPKVECPQAEIHNGFPKDPGWDALKDDVPTAELLGRRQLDFLEYWAADWSGGTWMKFAVSQTLFACLATEPYGDSDDTFDPRLHILPMGEYPPNDWMMADHDSDGWPQRGRNEAIRKWRKGFAMHLSGDQHLGTTSHYGVDDFRDGVYAVCTPAISNIFPRRWFPAQPGKNALPDTRNTGDYLDRFGNRITVLAVANPHRYPGAGLEALRHRATGYSIVRCNRQTRDVYVAVWPRWIDPAESGARPYNGWPVTVKQLDNGLHGAGWALGKIETPGRRDQVVQVLKEPDREVVYTVRINGSLFSPLVREPGTYTVVAFDPDGGYRQEWKGLQASKLQE